MGGIFDVNGPIMNGLRKLATVIICNIFVCLFFIPIFTGGAAMAAMYACIQKEIDDDDTDNVIFQFFREFRRNFKRATLLWLVCLAAFLFLFLFYMIISMFTGIFLKMYMVGFLVICLFFFFGFQYIFPLQARYENTVGGTLKNAWLLSILAFPWTIGGLAVVAAAVYISFFMNPNGINLAIFLWLTCIAGVIAYIQSLLFRNAFKKIDPRDTSEINNEPDSEKIFIDEMHRSDDSEYESGERSFLYPDWNRRDIGGSYESEKTKKKRR